jgi:hypothetical protein
MPLPRERLRRPTKVELTRNGRPTNAKSGVLRAAKSLARLWRDQGKVQQARELLAPVYG